MKNLNDLGVNAEVGDNELVKSCVMLMIVVDENGDERLEVGWTPGMSFVERAGMLRTAEQTDYHDMRRDDRD